MIRNKPNPFISSAVPFEIPLAEEGNRGLPVMVIENDLKDLISNIKYKLPNRIIKRGKTKAESILSIFEDDLVRAGPLSLLKKSRESILGDIVNFVNNKRPIEFLILAVPFKAPNPLKVSHVGCDLGEVAFVLRLYEITRLIKEIYNPGARFLILSEGLALSSIMGVSEKEAVEYREQIKKLVKELNLEKQVIILDLLEDAVSKFKNFQECFNANILRIKKEFEGEEKEVLKQVELTLPTIFFSISTRKFRTAKLVEIYTKDSSKTRELKRIALDKTFLYLSFHKTRYDLKVIEKTFPGVVRTTLTPRVGSLGILPVNNKTNLFPHHGAGVLLKNKSITVKYEFDIRRSDNFREVYLKGLNYPFYFEEI